MTKGENSLTPARPSRDPRAGSVRLVHRGAGWELDLTGSLSQAQTVALTTLVVYQVFQAGNARSETESILRVSPFSNKLLFAATAAALGIHIAALYFPPTQLLLRVEPIEPAAWVRIVLVATSILIAMEVHKFIRRNQSTGKTVYLLIDSGARARCG